MGRQITAGFFTPYHPPTQGQGEPNREKLSQCLRDVKGGEPPMVMGVCEAVGWRGCPNLHQLQILETPAPPRTLFLPHPQAALKHCSAELGTGGQALSQASGLEAPSRGCAKERPVAPLAELQAYLCKFWT